jgi:hypothetical protein
MHDLSNKFAIETLLFALSLKRPHQGKGVQRLSTHIVKLIPNFTIDQCGNIHCDLRETKENKTLFVAHLDTVHVKDGRNFFDYKKNLISAKGSQLGADDGAGVAVLMHLIVSNVPAYYIFTQGEEVGGIGAKHLRHKHEELLKQFDRAIAFDRRGTTSVITHQSRGRSCSDEFAESVADALNAQGLLYMPDDTGTYTDTAEFIALIPECTNVSVGYEREHSKNESLCMTHFCDLCNAVVKIKWDALPTTRDTSKHESLWGWLGQGSVDELGFYEAFFYSQVEEAIQDALSGRTEDLKALILDAVLPYQRPYVELSLKSITFTDDVLYQGLQMLYYSDPYDALDVILELTDPTLV